MANKYDFITGILGTTNPNYWNRDPSGYVYPKNITDGIYKEITVEELRDLIDNSQLGVNQWYLLTDYKTVSRIAGSEPAEYHEGDIEQIYVTALSSNKLSSIAYSKDHPDEILTFDQTYLSLPTGMTNNGEEGGTWSSFEITSDTATTLKFNTATLDDIENVTDFYVYCDLYSPLYDIYSFELTESTPRGEYWDYNPTSNIFSLLKINAWIWDELSGGVSSVLTFTPITASTLGVTHPAGFDIGEMVDGYIYIDDGSISLEFTAAGRGVDWEWAGGVLTDLTGTLDFTSGSLYIEWNTYSKITATGAIDFTGGFYFDVSYYYPSGYEQKGIITARNNTTRKLYVETDYRGRLFRRYKADATDWSAGTYSAGNIVRYSGYIWRCLYATTDTPSDSSVYWMKMFSDGGYYLPYGGLSYLPNNLTYYDSSMFDLVAFDASTSPLYTSFKSSLGYDFDVVVSNINNITNTNIIGTQLYLGNTIQNSDLRIDTSILNQVYNSSIKLGGGLNSTYTINASTLGFITSCAFYSIDKSTIDEAGNTFSRNIINLTKIKYINASLFSGYTYNNTIGWANYVKAFGIFQENDIVTIEYCDMSGLFDRNQLAGFTRYVNFLNSFSGNVSMSAMYGTSNSSRMTFGTTEYNVFIGVVQTNYFSSTSIISKNYFGGTFSNHFSSSVPCHVNAIISDNTFLGAVGFWNGAGRFTFSGNRMMGTVHKVTFSNTAAIIFRFNNAYKSFSDISLPVRFMTTAGGCVVQYNQFFGNVWWVDFYQGDIQYNTFVGNLMGDANILSFGSTGSITFEYNYFGKDVTDKVFTADLRRTYDLRKWVGATTSANDQIVTANFATDVKVKTTTYQILVTDHTIVADGASDFTITLPVAVVGQEFIIKNINDGVVTLEGKDSDTIDGELNKLIRKLEVIKVKCYAANSWVIVNDGGIPSRTRVWTENYSTDDNNWARVTFENENWDERDEWDLATPEYRFTAKEAGYYDVDTRLELKEVSGSNADAILQLAFYINGSIWSYGVPQQLTDSGGSVLAHSKVIAADHSDQVYLAVGDYLEVYAFTDTGSDNDVANADGSAKNYLAIHKLS